MIPNSVDGYAAAIVVLLTFGASSKCAAAAAAAVTFIRSFKRTEKQFVSIKKLETLHKLHIRVRRGIYA